MNRPLTLADADPLFVTTLWNRLENVDTPYDVRICAKEDEKQETPQTRHFVCLEGHFYEAPMSRAFQCPLCIRRLDSNTFATFRTHMSLMASTDASDVCWQHEVDPEHISWHGITWYPPLLSWSLAHPEEATERTSWHLSWKCTTPHCCRISHLSWKRKRETVPVASSSSSSASHHTALQTYADIVALCTPIGTQGCLVCDQERVSLLGHTKRVKGQRKKTYEVKKVAYYLYHQQGQGSFETVWCNKQKPLRLSTTCGRKHCCAIEHLQISSTPCNLESYEALLSHCLPPHPETQCIEPKEAKHRSGFYYRGSKRSLMRLAWSLYHGYDIQEDLDAKKIAMKTTCGSYSCAQIAHIEAINKEACSDGTPHWEREYPLVQLQSWYQQALSQMVEIPAVVNDESLDLSAAPECWVSRERNTQGYGVIYPFPEKPQVYLLLHRISYMCHHKQTALPQWYVIRHLCQQRCFRPEHLCLGTHKENAQDRVRAGKQGNSTLTPQDVRDIQQSTEPLSELKSRYDLSVASLRKIQQRKTWTALL